MTGCSGLAVSPSLTRERKLLRGNGDTGLINLHSKERESLDLERWRPIHVAALESKTADKNEDNPWAWNWISVFWGTRGFLYFAEWNGLEQRRPQVPQIGYLVNKKLLPFPSISVLWLYAVAGSQIPFCPVTIWWLSRFIEIICVKCVMCI